MIESNATRRVRALGMALLLAFSSITTLSAAPKDQRDLSAVNVTMDGLGCSSTAGKDMFQVQSWSWGASTPTSTSSSGAGVGKTTVSGMKLTKSFDVCSTYLIRAATSGKHYSSFKIVQTDAAGLPFLTITLTEAMLSAYDIGGAPGSLPAETLTVEFASVCFEYNSSGAKACFDKTKSVPA